MDPIKRQEILKRVLEEENYKFANGQVDASLHTVTTLNNYLSQRTVSEERPTQDLVTVTVSQPTNNTQNVAVVSDGHHNEHQHQVSIVSNVVPPTFQIKSEVQENEENVYFYEHILQSFSNSITNGAANSPSLMQCPSVPVEHIPNHNHANITEPSTVLQHPYNFYYSVPNAGTNHPSQINPLELYGRQQNAFFVQRSLTEEPIRQFTSPVQATYRGDDPKRRKSNTELTLVSPFTNVNSNRLNGIHKDNQFEMKIENTDHSQYTTNGAMNYVLGQSQEVYQARNTNVNELTVQKSIQNTQTPQNSRYTQADAAYKTLIEAEYANIKGEYACWKCSEVFPSKRKLKQHSTSCSMPDDMTELQDEGKVGKFMCEQCPYKCQSPAILKIHERTHSGEKPYSCNFCDYKSGQKNNVAKHILVHMKEKPFRCQYCEYRCAQKNNLVVHERTHTGFKPFACTYCEYKTVQKPNLVKHMYLHTNEKPFGCDICNYRCVQKTNLVKHRQKHNNERKPFSNETGDYVQRPPIHRTQSREKNFHCDLCSYRCALKITFDKHKQNKHNVQPPTPALVKPEDTNFSNALKIPNEQPNYENVPSEQSLDNIDKIITENQNIAYDNGEVIQNLSVRKPIESENVIAYNEQNVSLNISHVTNVNESLMENIVKNVAVTQSNELNNMIAS